jgi:hypothetical protein
MEERRMYAMVPIQRDALEFLAGRPGPYSKPDAETGEIINGFWHKTNHTGSDTCVGCALEEGLQAAPLTGDTAR